MVESLRPWTWRTDTGDPAVQWAWSFQVMPASVTMAATGRKLDLDRTLAGDETVEEAVTGCPAGTAVDLWTIEGGGHVPAFNEHWADAIWAFMATHPKAAAAS